MFLETLSNDEYKAVIFSIYSLSYYNNSPPSSKSVHQPPMVYYVKFALPIPSVYFDSDLIMLSDHFDTRVAMRHASGDTHSIIITRDR